jgi:hypothetical protein
MNEPEIVIRIPLRFVQALRELFTLASENNGSHEIITSGESAADDRPWTDAQKRMVYRLAHQLGYEGDAARNFIAVTLRLQPGQPPGRKEASRLIDTLKDQLGPHGNGARREAP